MRKFNHDLYVLGDNDAAYLREPFQDLLDKKQIAINYNALHDHHVMGIIDNFARRLKTILTRIFLKDHTTKWIDRINNIIRIYNNTEHSSINDFKPNEAEKHKQEIFEINVQKNNVNKTVSDLSIGDKVRKSLTNSHKSIIKGTDPRWTDKVFKVSAIRGHTH